MQPLEIGIHPGVREVAVNPGSPGRTTFFVHPDDAGGLGFERELQYAGSPYASAVTGVSCVITPADAART